MMKKVFWLIVDYVIFGVILAIVFYPVIFDRGYTQGVRDAYNAKNGLQISEAYLPDQIAGAADDGVRRVYAKD